MTFLLFGTVYGPTCKEVFFCLRPAARIKCRPGEWKRWNVERQEILGLCAVIVDRDVTFRHGTLIACSHDFVLSNVVALPHDLTTIFGTVIHCYHPYSRRTQHAHVVNFRITGKVLCSFTSPSKFKK
ncbi:hypothetical protein APHAL10511_008054 [Amanita phalloides]|nr:hypothetical protein APHAL10511_008054 [Amanita phalloides]